MLNTTDDFLKLVNAVARVVKPELDQDISSIDTPFIESGLDSLDGLLTCMYICEIYGVPEEAAKNWHPISIREVYDFILLHKTKEPTTLEEALEYIQ
jgi:hypothetical protein